MHPNEFRDRWNLTVAETAAALGITEHQFRCYALISKNRRNPSLSVQLLCDALDREWQRQSSEQAGAAA